MRMHRTNERVHRACCHAFIEALCQVDSLFQKEIHSSGQIAFATRQGKQRADRRLHGLRVSGERSNLLYSTSKGAPRAKTPPWRGGSNLGSGEWWEGALLFFGGCSNWRRWARHHRGRRRRGGALKRRGWRGRGRCRHFLALERNGTTRSRRLNDGRWRLAHA